LLILEQDNSQEDKTHEQFAGDVPLANTHTANKDKIETREDLERKKHEELVKGSKELQEVKAKERETRKFVKSEIERLAPRKKRIAERKRERAEASKERRVKLNERRAAREKEQDDQRQGEYQDIKSEQKLKLQNKANSKRQAVAAITAVADEIKKRARQLEQEINKIDGQKKNTAIALRKAQNELKKLERKAKADQRNIAAQDKQYDALEDQISEHLSNRGSENASKNKAELARLKGAKNKMSLQLRLMKRGPVRMKADQRQLLSNIRQAEENLKELDDQLRRKELAFKKLKELQRKLERARFAVDPSKALAALKVTLGNLRIRI